MHRHPHALLRGATALPLTSPVADSVRSECLAYPHGGEALRRFNATAGKGMRAPMFGSENACGSETVEVNGLSALGSPSFLVTGTKPEV